jgi:hypothetical protein
MAKIDCSTVLGFVHEAVRLCETYKDCDKCPMTRRKKCPMMLLDYDDPDVQSVVDALQAWSDEHPAKTRLEDLLEKYPNADIVDGKPLFYPVRLGYCKGCDRCNIRGLAKECWHEPVVGGATGKAGE